MTADGHRAVRDRERADGSFRLRAMIALNIIPIFGFCVGATSCSYRHAGPADSGEATAGPRSGSQVDDYHHLEIANAWKEEDQIVHEHLDSSGWIDRPAGVAHLSIDRAVDLILLEKGSSGPVSGESATPAALEKNTAVGRTGHDLFRKYGCDICHSPGAYAHAPSLVGIFGERVRLNDGTFVRADDLYLRNSILNPGMQVVAGYEPTMPSFGGYIPEPEVVELIAYLKSFNGTEGGPAASP